MRKCIMAIASLLLPLLVLASPAHSQRNLQYDELMEAYRSDSPERRQWAHGYIKGLIHGLETANAIASYDHSVALFCSPLPIDLTVDQAVNMLDNYRWGKEDRLEGDSVSWLLLRAVAQAFPHPCR